MTTTALYVPTDARLLALDTTTVPAEETAAHIVKAMRRLDGRMIFMRTEHRQTLGPHPRTLAQARIVDLRGPLGRTRPRCLTM
jgi:hypothetical protein